MKSSHAVRHAACVAPGHAIFATSPHLRSARAGLCLVRLPFSRRLAATVALLQESCGPVNLTRRRLVIGELCDPRFAMVLLPFTPGPSANAARGGDYLRRRLRFRDFPGEAWRT